MALIPSYREMVAEEKERGETIWRMNEPLASESEPAFVERLLRAEHSPDPDLVEASMYWGTQEGTVVGRIALRHRLTGSLEEFGGHVGYEVRPSYRRRGIATEMLRLILLTERAREIGRLLLTCAPDNVASNRTILANGGVLTRTAWVENWKRQTNYYWIDV